MATSVMLSIRELTDVNQITTPAGPSKSLANGRTERNMFRTVWRGTPTSQCLDNSHHIIVRPEAPQRDRATNIKRMIVSRPVWYDIRMTSIVAVPNGGGGSGYVADPRLFRNVAIGVLCLALPR